MLYNNGNFLYAYQRACCLPLPCHIGRIFHLAQPHHDTIFIPFTKAIYSTIDGEREVLIEANELTVKGITDGGIIILR